MLHRLHGMRLVVTPSSRGADAERRISSCTHCRLKADPYLAELRAAAGVVHKDGVADLKGHILRVAERVRLLSGAAVAALTQHSTTKQRRRATL